MKRLLIAATFLITIAAVGAGLVYSWGHQRFTGPGPLDDRKVVLIERGAGLEAIARQLTQEGVIRSPLLFRVGARVTGQATQLKAGEYEFPAEVSPQQALQIVVSGKTVARSLTIPEGLTSHEVVARIREAPALQGEIGEVPDEGTLLPETYHYQRGDGRAELLRRMQESMDRALAENGASGADRERVLDAEAFGRRRDQLHQPLRVLRADGVGVEGGFHRDHAEDEFGVERVARGDRFDDRADRRRC